MKTRPTFKKFASFALVVLCLGKASVLGCGIDWHLPKFHFPDTNEWGELSYWENLGHVEMGPEQIPIHIHFLSARKNSSPYLGYGWSLPLLESRIVQDGENTFKLWQPEGRFRDFGRDSKNPNLLHGQGGWKAEIIGDVIHAYADCGWSLSFKKGKIISIGIPSGEIFRYRYKNGLVSAIEEAGSGRNVLEVMRDDHNDKISKIKVGERQIVLEQGEKPRIEKINGQNLVGGVDQSLTKFNYLNGKIREISYDIDTQNIVPTFKPAENRTIRYDEITNTISEDNHWKYHVKTDRQIAWNNASIKRINVKTNDTEFWHEDRFKGKEIVKNSDGTEFNKTWFTSGKLAGKIRKITEKKNGSLKEEIYKPVYDEEGKLMYESTSGITVKSVDGIVKVVNINKPEDEALFSVATQKKE